MNQQNLVETTQAPSTTHLPRNPLLCAVFSETQTADYTGISVSSLRKGRMNGRRDNYVEPPPYLKLGRRIVYLKTDLDAWLMSHRVEL